MKIELGKIISAVPSEAFKKLDKAIPPGPYRFTCARFLEACSDAYRRYLAEQNAAIRRYGVRDGDRITIIHPNNTPENLVAFHDTMQALLALEIELPGEGILYTRLDQAAQDSLTVGDIRMLGPLLITEDGL